MICLMRLLLKKNKNKIKPLANTILDKFLKGTIALNIISFTKTRKIIVWKSSTSNYGNYSLVTNNTIDVSKSVQLLIKNIIFKKQLC